MVLYFVLLFSFFAFGINAGLRGTKTPVIEVGLGITLSVLKIAILISKKVIPAIITLVTGVIAGKMGYELSPKLR